MEGNGTRYTFQTTDAKTWTCHQGTDASSPFSFALNGEKAVLQAFHPAGSAVTAITSGSTPTYTLPVTIPATQTFAGNNHTECSATDYLYGSKSPTRGSAEAITANALNASPTIYMQHALSQVAFKIQYDADRTADNEHDCVKSVRLLSSTNSFKTTQSDGSGTMQINDGTLGNLTATGTLTFNATSNTEIPVGNYNSPSIVAYGLVAPISKPGGNITLEITLGKKGNTTYDRTYTATTTVFNVAWEKGYCYIYNLVLGNKLKVQQVTTSWTTTPEDQIPTINPKEKGIGSITDLVNFANAWNANGLAQKEDGTFDYSPYEPYGWYEKNSSGKPVFTIKITQSFTVLKGELDWIPIGNATHPLTLPIDGQGWQIAFDFSNGKQTVTNGNTYAGIIGYTQSSISNLRVLCTIPSGSAADNNYLEAGNAAYVGILAGKSEGDITNCTVELQGTTLVSTPSSPTSELYAGGLVGHCTKNISNCAVYQALSTSGAPTGGTIRTAPQTDITGYMGALAGKADGTVTNCYTYVSNLTADTSSGSGSAIHAGWLAGSSNGTFSKCYYIAGTATGCTPGETSTTDVTEKINTRENLCTLLNKEVEDHPLWTKWAERSTSDASVITSVFLFDYRNKKNEEI